MPLVVYSVLRLALFGVALLGLWAAGMGGWLLVVVAAFVAWALSYVVLARPRDAAALWLAGRAERRRTSGARFSAGVQSDAAAEDAEAERAADDVAAEQGGDGEATPPVDVPAAPPVGPSAPPQRARPRPSSTP